MKLEPIPAWRKVERAIVNDKRWTWGDLIPSEEIDEMLGLSRPGADDRADQLQAYQLGRLQQLDALRNHMLREHRMHLNTEPGLGIRIVLPHEQTAVVQSKGRSALAKALRDMRDGLAYVDTSQLTAEQRKENTDAQVRLAARVQALKPIDRAIIRIGKEVR